MTCPKALLGAENQLTMSVSRTSPVKLQPNAGAKSEDRLRAHYRSWRCGLHKAKDYRVKVLRTLAQEGDTEAAQVLVDPPHQYGAVQCKECAGCHLMAKEKSCQACHGCLQGQGCEEHHRRCQDWLRSFTTFHDGSKICGHLLAVQRNTGEPFQVRGHSRGTQGNTWLWRGSPKVSSCTLKAILAKCHLACCHQQYATPTHTHDGYPAYMQLVGMRMLELMEVQRSCTIWSHWLDWAMALVSVLSTP